jgi:hypothetical protein
LSQVYSIVTAAIQSETVVSRFLDEWQAVGSYELVDNSYALTAHTGEEGLVTVEDHEIIFQGKFSDDGFYLIVSLAEVMETELLLEGQPLERDSGIPKWQNFGWLGKTSGTMLVPVILLMTLLFILTLPVLLIVFLVRLLFTTQKIT